MKIPLSEIKIGEHGFICDMSSNSQMKLCLNNIGVTKGSNIKCVYSAITGDPRAYIVRDRMFALRGEDSGKIIVSVDRQKLDVNTYPLDITPIK